LCLELEDELPRHFGSRAKEFPDAKPFIAYRPRGDCRCGGAHVAQELWVLDVRVVCRGERQLGWPLESFEPLAHSDPA